MSAAPRAFASFLAALLVLVPLPGHWRARNIPTLSLIAWLFFLNVAHGVNVIEWYDNIAMKLEIWCDIIRPLVLTPSSNLTVSKLVIGGNMAIPVSCFCLALRLEGIAAVRHVKTSHSDRRRKMLTDLALCVGLPVIEMALHYVVQGHRFDIVERFGCQPASYVSLAEFFLIWFIPIILCLGTFALGALAFFHFFKRRATFARHLAASNTGLTPSRYFRLMAMSLALMIWDLVVVALTLVFNYRPGLRPWTGWADVHSNWLHVNRFPVFLIPADTLRWTYFLWWTIPVTAYMFFAFFAFSRDALTEYGTYLTWLKEKVLRIRPSPTKGVKALKDSSFAPLGSATSRPPRFGVFSYASQPDVPYTPTSAKETTRLSYPASPGLQTSASSIVSFYGRADEPNDEEKDHDFTTSTVRARDDAAPPYQPHSASFSLSQPSSPTTPTIVPPPPALVVEAADNASIISQYAHSDRTV
ncbi:pheromone A receptor-domain-containing protein [Fomes fomentarius]|nr:pheromone A receptor-domain-containing protein [Fomes fomentarius]